MPRSARQTPGRYVYHALNRATARLKLFRKAAETKHAHKVFVLCDRKRLEAILINVATARAVVGPLPFRRSDRPPWTYGSWTCLARNCYSPPSTASNS